MSVRVAIVTDRIEMFGMPCWMAGGQAGSMP
jgi:hypothetical protein